jgi:hypothetical protein
MEWMHILLVTGLVTLASGTVWAQEPADREIQGTDQFQAAFRISGGLPFSIQGKQGVPTPVSASASQIGPPLHSTHRFWDRTNGILFAGVGAARALDYASTLNLRRRGLDEIFLTNSIVDNHPLFAGIEAAATAASIGVSYLFHRTGHHQLERWTSIVHFGVAAGGAARNYALKTNPN